MSKFDVNIWMPLYIGDFLRDTAGMDAKMIGAVVLLYIRIWSKNGPLEDDNEKLGRICQMSADRFVEIRDEISFLFDVRNSQWTHDELLAERAKWVETRRRRSAAARVAANAKYAKPNGPNTDPQGLPDDAY